MQVKINRQKVSSVSNLTILAYLHGLPAPEEFLNWKNQFLCPKTLFLDNTVPSLEPAYIWKHFEILKVKSQDNLQNTSVNINSYRSWNLRQFWTQLPLNNRQKL